ncbi:MAG: hypothetical protein IJJ44_03380 [Solobacterium sp.]|nr:hypothetical protein [Solobacterium sp.]
MAYATVEDVEKGFRELDADEEEKCEALLDEADVLIDAVASSASLDAKKVVECRIVRRALGDGSGSSVPMGSTQGSVSALGYSQSWTLSGGATGELYIGKTERQILGLSNRIGVTDPYGVSQ